MSEIAKHADTKLYGRAINEEWPIKPEFRQAIVNHLMKVVLDPAYKESHKATAIRALMNADAQNKTNRHNDDLDDGRNRFLDLAERAGIGAPPALDASGRPRGGGGDASGGIAAQP